MRYWPLLIVVAGVTLGLGVAWFVPDGWRLGCLVVGCSLGIGAVIRLLLPRAEAGLRLVLVESGGDNLTASFSYGLVDKQIFVVDVAGGDKVPRKGGPGVTRSVCRATMP